MNKKWLALPAAGAAIAGGIILGTGGIADAHTVTLGGQATCETNGLYEATYRMDLAQVPDGTTGTFSLVSTTPNGIVTGLPTTHVGNGVIGPFDVDGIAGNLTSTSITIHAAWSDGFSTDASYAIALAGTCSQPPPTTTTTTVPPTTTTTTVPPTTTTTLPVPCVTSGSAGCSGGGDNCGTGPSGTCAVTTPIVPIPAAAPLANPQQELQQVQVAPGVTGGNG